MQVVFLPICWQKVPLFGHRLNMVQLTRLNNQQLMVNSDLIKFVECSPDTVITLINGEKIVVRESVEEILQRIVEFRRSVMEAKTESGIVGASAAEAEQS